MSYDDQDDDVFSSSSKFRGRGAPRKQPSRQTVRTNGAPRALNGGGSTLADAFNHVEDEDAADAGGAEPVGSRFSLAHELAAALMPEPSAGAALLDEFGIDYDEGAEGIDGEVAEDTQDGARTPTGPQDYQVASHPLTPAARTPPAASPMSPKPTDDLTNEVDSSFGSPASSRRNQPEADPMEVLAQDLSFTESFLSHLRRIDADLHPSFSNPAPTTTSAEPAGLEQLASTIIRRLTDTAREREGQVRALREAERELRKIGAEVGGDDVLASLDELEDVKGLSDVPASISSVSVAPAKKERRARMDDAHEEDGDWESEMERRLRGDEEEDEEEDAQPIKDSFVTSQPILSGPPTPAASAAHLADLRTLTLSLSGSLATLSEQTQVNGAANAAAGRQLRSLKNKLGTWRAEFDTAERARLRIERWESGAPIDGTLSPMGTPNRTGVSRRIDGRKLVEEHLRGYERALNEASMKIGVIMAASA